MTNPDLLPIRTRHNILPPTPAIPTPLIQRHTTQRRAHLQPRKPLRLGVPLQRPRLAVPHHHGPEALARKRRVREDCPNRGAVSRWVALCGHA